MTYYDRPDDLEAALAIMAQGPQTILAGGTDLYPATQAQDLAGPVLDITGVAGLRGLTQTDGHLRIGACTTWAEIARADLPGALVALQEAAREVGGRQIQNAGTIAGNLCNASPAADGAPPLLVLDAAVELASPRGRREVPLAEFLTGPRQTVRAADEIVTVVLVPEAALAGRSQFLKLGARRHLVISIATVAVRLVVDGDRVADSAVAVGSCGPVARRLAAVEAALRGAPLADAAGRVRAADVVAALSPIADVRASADYRAEAAAELVRRTVTDLAGAA